MGGGLLFVSPHRDDAVFSSGEAVAAYPGSVVATVFGARPADGGLLTAFDALCGFASAREAVDARICEDMAACAALGAESWSLSFTDGQYGEARCPGSIAAALAATAAKAPSRHVVGPLGLVHPDHLAVRDALAAVLAAREQLQGWVYEDLPSRVLWPEQVPDALDWWCKAGFEPVFCDLVPTGRPHRALKLDAVRCYRSQLGAALVDETCVMVPERHWRLERR